jgi:hypothetical protein
VPSDAKLAFVADEISFAGIALKLPFKPDHRDLTERPAVVLI